jgi:hypothetical protein
MNGHLSNDVLNALAGGALTDAADAEAHLAACEACAGEVRALKSLTAELSALPREDRLERDLFPGIAARIAKPKARWSTRAIGLALAAAIAAITLFTRPFSAPMREDLRGELRGVEAEYDIALGDLHPALDAKRAAFAPEVAGVIDASLREIDDAIRSSREALDRDPSSREAAVMVASAYQSKLDMLRLIERTAQ